MKNKYDYIKYKQQKAAQSIKEAKLLMENGLNDTAISRLYYAAFYAINALLAINGFNPKHTAELNQFSIKNSYSPVK